MRERTAERSAGQGGIHATTRPSGADEAVGGWSGRRVDEADEVDEVDEDWLEWGGV